jgi:hypothetical protein
MNSWFFMIIAVLIYTFAFHRVQFRWPLAIATLFSLGGALYTISLIQTKSIQLVAWMFCATLGDQVYSALTQMPLSALFCKMIPDKCETSMFALCMCFTSVGRVTTPLTGSYFAKMIDSTIFFPEFQKLFVIQAAFAILSLTSVLLIPLRKDVSKVQSCLDYLRLSDKMPENEQANEYMKLDHSVARRLTVIPPDGAIHRSEVSRVEEEENDGLLSGR